MTQQIAVFLTSVILARELGPNDFGTIGILKNLSTVVLLIAPLGLDLALLKHASFYRDRPIELRSLSTALRVLVAALNIIVLLATATFLGPWLQTLYNQDTNFSYYCVITMLGVAFAADLQISGALFRVSSRISEFSLAFLYFQPIFRIVLSVLLLKLGFGIQGMIWVTSGSYLVTLIIVERLNVTAPTQGTSSSDFDLVQSIATTLHESLWMAMSLVVYQMMRFADVLVLGTFVPASVTGQYIAASGVAQIIQIYPAALSQSLGPRIADLYRAGSLEGIADELQRYVRLAAILGGYLFAGVAIFGTDLDLVFGPSFHFSFLLTALLALGWFVSATLAPLGYALSMTGRHRAELIILIVGAVVLMGSLYVLIPRLLEIGAATAVLISFVFVNIVRCTVVIKLIGRSPLKLVYILPPTTFFFIAWACQTLVSKPFERSFAVLLLGCIVYTLAAFAVWLMLFANPSERAAIKSRLKRRGVGR